MPLRYVSCPLAAAAAAAALLAGCGGKPASTPTATTSAAAPFSVLGGPAEKVTFPQVDQAVSRLYRRRPGLLTFVVRDVDYSRATSDKVLEICHHGGLELNLAALESSRLAGCAPLIFFFYNFGRAKNAPDAVAVARMIYWYAIGSIRGPFDARATLDALLQTWAVQ